MDTSYISDEGKTENWEKMFPADQNTGKNRLTFMFRITYVAFAQYLMERKLLPRTSFVRHRLDETPLYNFNTKDRLGKRIHEILKGMKEAIDKKYLHQALIVVNEDPANIDHSTEVFTITLTYNKDQCFAIIDAQGNKILTLEYTGEEAFRKQVKDAISDLKKTLRRLLPFQERCAAFIKLLYHNNTPKEYEPNFFKPTNIAYRTTPGKVYNDWSCADPIQTNSTAVLFDLLSLYFPDDFNSGHEDA